jgi:hypothetical protein
MRYVHTMPPCPPWITMAPLWPQKPTPAGMDSPMLPVAPLQTSGVSSGHTWAVQHRNLFWVLNWWMDYSRNGRMIESNGHNWEDVVKHGRIPFCASVRRRFWGLADKSYNFFSGMVALNLFRWCFWHLKQICVETIHLLELYRHDDQTLNKKHITC